MKQQPLLQIDGVTGLLSSVIPSEGHEGQGYFDFTLKVKNNTYLHAYCKKWSEDVEIINQ